MGFSNPNPSLARYPGLGNLPALEKHGQAALPCRTALAANTLAGLMAVQIESFFNRGMHLAHLNPGVQTGYEKTATRDAGSSKIFVP